MSPGSGQSQTWLDKIRNSTLLRHCSLGLCLPRGETWLEPRTGCSRDRMPSHREASLTSFICVLSAALSIQLLFLSLLHQPELTHRVPLTLRRRWEVLIPEKIETVRWSPAATSFIFTATSCGSIFEKGVSFHLSKATLPFKSVSLGHSFQLLWGFDPQITFPVIPTILVSSLTLNLLRFLPVKSNINNLNLYVNTATTATCLISLTSTIIIPREMHKAILNDY